MEKYLQILSDSLQKKSEVLDALTNKTKEQTGVIGAETIDWDVFDKLVDEKDTLLQEMEKLDEGFDAMYQRVREELLENKEKYRMQISDMQAKIGKITEQSAGLMAMEERNKALVSSKLMVERQKIKQGKVSSQVATNYYRNMNKINYIDPQLMDKKK